MMGGIYNIAGWGWGCSLRRQNHEALEKGREETRNSKEEVDRVGWAPVLKGRPWKA